jgi:hypothetical protein
MQVTIKGRPVTDLPANWQKDIRLGSERAEITGAALGMDEAAARFLSRYRIVCACFVVFVWLVLYAMLAFAQPGDRTVLVPFGLVMAALTPLVFVAIYFVRRGRLLASLPERAKAAPPPGMAVRVDASGLTIGGRFAAWNDVTLDKVDFELLKGRYGSRTLLVHQVTMRARDFAYTLDGLLMDQGHLIVAETYRHKCNGRPPLVV